MANLIDLVMTWLERHSRWGTPWSSRVFGVAIGWVRIIGWRLDGCGPLGLAWAMWQARYWIDWRLDEDEEFPR